MTMQPGWPKIKARQRTEVSPWVDLIAREVEFSPGEQAQVYHSIGQADYLAIVARTADGRLPIVRQYRPAVEAFTWELPAGLAEPGEDLAEGCRRELLEETGYTTRTIVPLGSAIPCTGRMSNRIHSFFIEAGEPMQDFKPEQGLTVRLVTAPELCDMIRSGEFAHQLHLGALLQAQIRSLISLQVK